MHPSIFTTADSWHNWLTHHIKPGTTFQQLASHQQPFSLTAGLALSLLPRLQETLFEAAPTIAIHMECTIDNARAPFARMHIHVYNASETPLTLACQRCMTAMPWQLDSRSSFWLAPNEERYLEADLPEEDEVFFYDEIVDLIQLIEDEALLSCPHSPRHAENQCRITPNLSESRAKVVETKQSNPFAILAQLKKTSKE